VKNGRKPASSFARNQLKKHMVKKSCRAAESIRNATTGQFYRADLADAAVARYHAIYKSLKVTLL
jgi:DNA-binding transcriptional regulator YdaS (Cro superfamily)